MKGSAKILLIIFILIITIFIIITNIYGKPTNNNYSKHEIMYTIDTDKDGIRDTIDVDDDNDGFNDDIDAFPLGQTEWLDTDSDGIGDNIDVDDDNDKWTDVVEVLCGTDPFNPADFPLDSDNDGIADILDVDDDNDGFNDDIDAFPLDSNKWLDADDEIGNDTGSKSSTPNDYPGDNNKTLHMIYDNLGRIWEPTGENLVIAFNSLQKNAELWIPSGKFYVNKNLCISNDGIKIHGHGDDTIIVFSNGAKIISSLYADSSSDTKRWSIGLNNIQLDNFKFTGDGHLELVLGNNTLVKNVKAENIYCKKPGAFRFILPNKVPKVYGLKVIGCSCYKVWWHGFVINSPLSGTYTIEDVLFEDCAVRYAGFEYEGRGPRNDMNGNWSVGFDFAENYQESKLTIKDVIVRNCIAEYCWESGFHMENDPIKINVLIENCKSNYNGQKRNYINTTGETAYCSGFLSRSSGVIIKNCQANYNTKYGYYISDSTTLINCIGNNNWIKLSNKDS